MQRCERMRRLIDGYVDGELSKGRRHRVEHHLDACAACRRYLEASRRVQHALKKETAGYAADPRLALLWPRIEGALGAAGPRGETPAWHDRFRSAWGNRRLSLRLVPAFAAVAAVLFLVVLPQLRHPEWIADEVVIEPVGGENVTYVVSRFKETDTSIIWIVEPNG